MRLKEKISQKTFATLVYSIMIGCVKKIDKVNKSEVTKDRRNEGPNRFQKQTKQKHSRAFTAASSPRGASDRTFFLIRDGFPDVQLTTVKFRNQNYVTHVRF